MSPVGVPVAALAPGEVHVWYVDLDGVPPVDGAGCLDASERDRADRFYRERDRRRFRASHCAFRHLVAGYLGCAPGAVRISRQCAHCGDPEHGKPAVTGPAGVRPAEVSASHGDALGAVAVARPPLEVGVDVERRRPGVDWAGILPDPAPGEPPGDPFDRWTRLEAVAKAAGTGIVTMPRLTGPAADGWGPAEVPGTGRGWQVRSLAAPDGYAAALAVSRIPAAGVRTHRYSPGVPGPVGE